MKLLKLKLYENNKMWNYIKIWNLKLDENTKYGIRWKKLNGN